MRAVKKVLEASPSKLVSETTSNGPTSSFLLQGFSSTDSKYKTNIKAIQAKRAQDPLIEKSVNEICKNEKKNQDCVPLYHGLSDAAYLNMLFNGFMVSLLEDEHFHQNLLPRFPNSSGPTNVDELKKLHPPEKYQESYDHAPAVQRELMSMSPCLFSNFNTDGESSWFFFITNKSVNPPRADVYFNWLCEKYQLIFTPEQKKIYEERFCALHDSLQNGLKRYQRLITPSSQRENREDIGVMLQILIPNKLVNDICYASVAYGAPDPKYPDLLTTLKDLRKNPISYPDLQIRVLAQSLMVPEHGIQIIPHGCGDFFSPIPPSQRPIEIAEKDWERLNAVLKEKNDTLNEVKGLFKEMIVNSTC